MVDVTVIATAAITGTVGLSGILLQARSARSMIQSDNARRDNDAAETRRRERQVVYERAIDLLALWQWDADRDPSEYDVVESFTKPFVLAATRIRVYGSPAAIAALDQVQEGLALLNGAQDVNQESDAFTAIARGQDALYDAARADVGPRPEDGLAAVQFLRGAGPRT